MHARQDQTGLYAWTCHVNQAILQHDVMATAMLRHARADLLEAMLMQVAK
jgi:hypothetical protein